MIICSVCTATRKTFMDVCLQICDYTKTDLNFTDQFFRGDFTQELHRILIDPMTIMVTTKFSEQSYNITDLWDPVLTEFGQCFSFNLVPLSLIYRENV